MQKTGRDGKTPVDLQEGENMYEDISLEVIEYIKNLDEYDEYIFNSIFN